MRALVVSNMLPDAAHPERGRFVRDQVAALRAMPGLEVELYEFAPGPQALAAASLGARRRGSHARRLDVVHAHFGLSAWPALAMSARVHALTVHGNDLLHPRTRLLTAAVLPFMDVIGAVSKPLARELPGRAARKRAQILPCGVDVRRFRPHPRERARADLGLDRDRPYLLFPADPARPEKRCDRAQALAQASGAQLLTLGGISPDVVPLWICAANAVIVPSEREGFGLAVLEALACEVPVLATPVGIHAQALEGIPGSLCAPFELARWRAALQSLLERVQQPGAGTDGAPPGAGGRPAQAARDSALRFSAERMAARVLEAWRAALDRSG